MAKRKAAEPAPLGPVLHVAGDEFYGDRVFMFLDPDGHEWKISQTIAAVDPDAIRKIVAAS
jgi:uncharacterized glyoxalase superfamily protein PhnB